MKSYVICLKGIETSEKLAEDCIESARLNGLEVLKFDGIFGDRVNSYISEVLKIKQGPAKMKKRRLGVLGCLASHFTLWKKSVDENDTLCIFEHDGILLRKLPEDIESKFDEFLLLDPYNKFNQSYAEQHLILAEDTFNVTEYDSPESRRKYNVKSQYAMGLQAYIIKPKAAKKLIKHIKLFGFVPADMQCNKDIINLQTVTSPYASINKIFYHNKSKMQELSTTQKAW